jgi:hypothetical protein
VQYFVYGGWRTWDTSDRAPSRIVLLIPWLLGFLAYQLVNPGAIGWWAARWATVRDWLHFTPPTWLSASLFSFAVAFLVALCVARRSTALETEAGEVTP